MEALEFLLLHAKQTKLLGAEETLNTIWATLTTGSQELRDTLMNQGSVDEVWGAAGKVAAALAHLADFYEERVDLKSPKKKKKAETPPNETVH